MSGGHHSIFGGRKSLFGEAGSEMVEVDLNLTPLMDVMSNILFFLLASFGAAILSFLTVSVPTQGEPAENPVEPPKDQVTANIQMRASEYRINLSGEGMELSRLQKFKRTLPKKGGAYDTEALQLLLFEVKKEFPGSDTAIVVPDEETVYEDLVETVEATKQTLVDGKKLKLFNKTVVADIVRADTEGGG